MRVFRARGREHFIRVMPLHALEGGLSVAPVTCPEMRSQPLTGLSIELLFTLPARGLCVFICVLVEVAAA